MHLELTYVIVLYAIILQLSQKIMCCILADYFNYYYISKQLILSIYNKT